MLLKWTAVALEQALSDVLGDRPIKVQAHRDHYTIEGPHDSLHRIASHANMAFFGLRHKQMLKYNHEAGTIWAEDMPPGGTRRDDLLNS